VLCDGDDLRLELINRRLVVGDGSAGARRDAGGADRARRGRQPAPAAAAAESARESSTSTCAATSTWTAAGCCTGCGCSASTGARPAEPQGKGTFWESWRLRWQPEFAVDLVEARATAPRCGGGHRPVASRRQARPLADVTALVERCLLADLPTRCPRCCARSTSGWRSTPTSRT
jgi:hypothetical protein